MIIVGYRGYVSSRTFFGERVPQHVQNIVIRHYCEGNNLQYLLSGVEVAIPGMYFMLNQVIAELHKIDGIVCYSLFQLPESIERRKRIFDEIVDSGKTMHFALEMLRVENKVDISKLNDIFSVKNSMQYCSSDCFTNDVVNSRF